MDVIPRRYGDSPGGLMYVTHDRNVPRTHGEGPARTSWSTPIVKAFPRTQGVDPG